MTSPLTWRGKISSRRIFIDEAFTVIAREDSETCMYIENKVDDAKDAEDISRTLNDGAIFYPCVKKSFAILRVEATESNANCQSSEFFH